MRKTVALLAALICTATAAYAQQVGGVHTQTTIKELTKLGANPRTFAITAISPNGQQVLATDEPTFNVKRHGVTRRVWMLDVDSAMKLKAAHSIDLSVPEIEQLAYTPDGRSLLLITRRGADLFRIDLSTGKTTRILGHVKGNPGVRVDPPVMAVYNGKMYVQGYPYNANDVAFGGLLYELNPMGVGVSALTPVLHLEKIEQSVKHKDFEVALCPEGLFFGHRSGQQEILDRWTAKDGLQNVDRGDRLTGAWGEGPRIVYAMNKGENHELVMADAVTGEHKVVASGSQGYFNPVLAKQGTTFMVATVDRASHTCNVWVGQDTNGYALQPLYTKIPLSVFRLSPDGQVLAAFNQLSGLLLTRLP